MQKGHRQITNVTCGLAVGRLSENSRFIGKAALQRSFVGRPPRGEGLRFLRGHFLPEDDGGCYLRIISCRSSELMTSRISARLSASCWAGCLPPRILSRNTSLFAARPSIAAWFLYSTARQTSQSSGLFLISLRNNL